MAKTKASTQNEGRKNNPYSNEEQSKKDPNSVCERTYGLKAHIALLLHFTSLLQIHYGRLVQTHT